MKKQRHRKSCTGGDKNIDTKMHNQYKYEEKDKNRVIRWNEKWCENIGGSKGRLSLLWEAHYR